jgi:hypothetical protein
MMTSFGSASIDVAAPADAGIGGGCSSHPFIADAASN